MANVWTISKRTRQEDSGERRRSCADRAPEPAFAGTAGDGLVDLRENVPRDMHHAASRVGRRYVVGMHSFDLEAWLATTPTPAPIVQAGASVLRRRAIEVPPALLGTPALGRLIDVMVATMRAAPGVGLAAPQIGVPLRVFVAEDTEEYLAKV